MDDPDAGGSEAASDRSATNVVAGRETRAAQPPARQPAASPRDANASIPHAKREDSSLEVAAPRTIA
jgi:hypothetical protein